MNSVKLKFLVWILYIPFLRMLYWVDPNKRAGIDRVFRGLAGLLWGISPGQSPREIPKKGPSSPRKTTCLLWFTFYFNRFFSTSQNSESMRNKNYFAKPIKTTSDKKYQIWRRHYFCQIGEESFSNLLFCCRTSVNIGKRLEPALASYQNLVQEQIYVKNFEWS